MSFRFAATEQKHLNSRFFEPTRGYFSFWATPAMVIEAFNLRFGAACALLHPAVCEASRFPYLVQVLLHPLINSCHLGIEIRLAVLNHTPLFLILERYYSIDTQSPSSPVFHICPTDPSAPLPLLQHTVKLQYNSSHKLQESTHPVLAFGTSEHYLLHQMPTQNLHLQESDGSFLIPPKALVTPTTSILETSFAPDMAIEEWTDWMQWDVGAIETGPTILERKHSFESTHSVYDTSETSPLSAHSTKVDFSFEDAPFDFEEVTESSQFSTDSPMLQYPRRPAQRCLHSSHKYRKRTKKVLLMATCMSVLQY